FTGRFEATSTSGLLTLQANLNGDFKDYYVTGVSLTVENTRSYATDFDQSHCAQGAASCPRDLFIDDSGRKTSDNTGRPSLLPMMDPFGVTLTHKLGDPMLHIQGERPVALRGDVQTYLGGEPVVDENGNPVYTGSQPFTYQPGQPKIDNRKQQVYGLVQDDGTVVAIDPTKSPNFAPPTVVLSGITAATTIDVPALTGALANRHALSATDEV